MLRLSPLLAAAASSRTKAGGGGLAARAVRAAVQRGAGKKATATVSAVAASATKDGAGRTRARNNAGKLHFDASKAGLQLVDKAYVERVIQEASKGTPFYQKEQRREEARREKTEAVLKKAAQYEKLSASQKATIKAKVDCIEADLEEHRDLDRRYIHVDMDMFYAAVEEKKNPSLRDVPFGVGSYQMLSTTNYIARQYGVRSGMPGFIGKKLCPDLLIVPNDFAAYKREAAVIHSIAARYDPHFVNLGLDELTMDVTRYLKLYPALTASEVCSQFRDEVYAKTHLTCSGGIAPTSALAKIASNVNKPNGQHEIALHTRNDTLDYVRRIPLRKIPGIGYAQELTLNALGIKTCGDLLKQKYLLFYLFKEKTFMNYLTIGLGLMEAHSHRQHEIRQSIGKESSFSEPLASPEAFVRLFRRLLEPCHAQCVKEHLLAQQMRLVLKYRTYDAEQYSVALPHPTNDLKLWVEASRRLLQPHLEHFADYRLVGVRLQKLVPEQGYAADAARYEDDADDDEDEDYAPLTARHGSRADGSSTGCKTSGCAAARGGALATRSKPGRAPVATTSKKAARKGRSMR